MWRDIRLSVCARIFIWRIAATWSAIAIWPWYWQRITVIRPIWSGYGFGVSRFGVDRCDMNGFTVSGVSGDWH